MKKLCTTLVTVFAIAQFSYAQNTYPWPTSGNVGIGTTSPNIAGTDKALTISGINPFMELNSTSGSHTQVRFYSNGVYKGGILKYANDDIGVAAVVGQGFGISIDGGSSNAITVKATSGNVGIGTTSPVSMLDVVGNGNFSQQISVASVNGGTSSFWGAVRIPQSNFYVANTLAYGRAIISTSETKNNSTPTAASTALFLSTNETDNPFGVKFQLVGNTTATSRYVVIQTGEHNIANNGNLILQSSGGNVGIGTTSPDFPFEVYKSTVNAGTQLGATTGYMLSRIHNANYNGGVMFGYDNATSNTGIIAGINDLQVWGYGSSWGPLATFKGNGNVGIGTTIPDEKLSVRGKIHANEVKVDLNVPGPDYVFELDYKLPQLSELKTYLNVNHHLPEIASAAEMVKNGLNLSEMNIRLLKKVEELTLYLIEKDKQLNDQETRLQKIETQLKTLFKN